MVLKCIKAIFDDRTIRSKNSAKEERMNLIPRENMPTKRIDTESIKGTKNFHDNLKAQKHSDVIFYMMLLMKKGK